MIVEYIRYETQGEETLALLQAYRNAAVHLNAAPECLRHEVTRGVEDPGAVIVRIEWTSVEAHEHGFRGGPHFPPFLELVRPFVARIREMKHYAPVRPAPPTLSEWIGGNERLRRVVDGFYALAKDDELLGSLFARVGAEHVEHVTLFLDEVFGGPATYGEKHGGHAEMVRHHIGKRLTEPQRKRWIELWLRSADACGVPDDPEFRSALVGYLEWGTRLAVQNSQRDDMPMLAERMPRWGWGEVGGPYLSGTTDEDSGSG